MTLFMVLAACFGVLQLAVLGWFGGRTVKIGTLLLCVLVGVYACGSLTLILEFLVTRVIDLRTASYTVDPFIEEFIKVTPLFLIAMHARVRRQFGMTDYVLLGAALGAGFGLLEAVLRVSHRAGTAQGSEFFDGWIVPIGLSTAYVPDFSAILGSWLPAPVTAAALSFATEPQTFHHLAWSAVAGLGVGLLIRGRGLWRLLGLLPILYVSAEHAALNYDLVVLGRSGLGDVLSAPLIRVSEYMWLYPLLCLVIAAVFDRVAIARGRAVAPEVVLPHDRAALLGFPFLRPPWTVLIATRFVRARRSLFYSGDPDLHTGVRVVRDMMAEAGRPHKWRRLVFPPRSFGPVRLVRDWRFWVWLVLALPSIVYFVLADFPSTAGFQNQMETAGVWRIALPAILVAGMLWLLWQMGAELRRGGGLIPGEPLARARLRLMAGLGGLLIGGYTLWQIAGGTRLNQAPFRNFHVLDALRAALLIVLLVLVLALLFTAFPPAGGLALAGFGTAGTGAVTISGNLVLGTAVVGTLSTILLMQASGNDGGSGGPSGPERDGIRLDSTNKVHTPPGQRLPSRVPDHWTRADLHELANDLRVSIATRRNEMLRLGEEAGHRARIADEEQLLRQIEKILSGS